MNKRNSLRLRIKNREVLFGTFAKINSPAVVEMIGMVGFDFAIFDMEHANFSLCDVENLIRTADSVELGSIVRVAHATPEDVLHALDSGAGGVQVPSITTMEQAKETCRSAKYYPDGNRGSSMAQRSAMYGIWNREQPYFGYANEHTAVVLHVENLELYAQIDALVELPQLDVVFVGPGDLSQAIGKPGQLDDPELCTIVEHIFEVTLKAGKAVGIFCGTPAATQKYIDMGATYIALGSDVSCLGSALASLKGKCAKLCLPTV
jgi:4-hydroxy-2-oxoheptanedioate aldolase